MISRNGHLRGVGLHLKGICKSCYTAQFINVCILRLWRNAHLCTGTCQFWQPIFPCLLMAWHLAKERHHHCRTGLTSSSTQAGTGYTDWQLIGSNVPTARHRPDNTVTCNISGKDLHSNWRNFSWSARTSFLRMAFSKKDAILAKKLFHKGWALQHVSSHVVHNVCT